MCVRYWHSFSLGHFADATTPERFRIAVHSLVRETEWDDLRHRCWRSSLLRQCSKRNHTGVYPYSCSSGTQRDPMGRCVSQVLAQLVAETMQQPRPPRSVSALMHSLVTSGANKDAVEAYLPSIAPQLFRRSGRRRGGGGDSDGGGSDGASSDGDEMDDALDDSDYSWDSDDCAPRQRRGARGSAAAQGAKGPDPLTF